MPDISSPAVQLYPLIPEDYPFLYWLASCEENAYRWRYRGQIPPYELFVQQLHADVLTQFVARDPVSGERIGHVVAYSADLRSGFCSTGSVMGPRYHSTGVGLRAVALLLDYVFRSFNIRKVYAELPEYIVGPVTGGRLGGFFQLEARLSQHTFYDGKYWDWLIFSLDRQEWPGYGTVYSDDLPNLGESIRRVPEHGVESDSTGGA